MSVAPEHLGERVKHRTGVLEKEHSVGFRNAKFIYSDSKKWQLFQAEMAVF
jgi:hypothetical protein